MTNQLNIVSKDELYELFQEEDRVKRQFIEYHGCREIDGLLYTVYKDKRNGQLLASRQVRTVHMGFNSNEEGKVEEFIAIVEREGACKASWGVTGRTMHEILAHQLAKELPQYDWEIDYQSYGCKATKK